MFDYHLSFQSPWYLALLAIVPVLWWLSFRTLTALGARRVPVLVLRTAVIVLLVLTLAEVQAVRTSQRLTVIYLLDQSLSIPAPQRRAMTEYVNAAIHKHRRQDDRVGVIVFGRDAAMEIPPFDDDVQMSPAIESPLDPEYTNLAAAMKLAQASFPEDAAKRIVLVSDGNQNLGNALEQGQALAAAGVGIDVVPIRYHSRAEVAVERVIIPSDVRRRQPFELRVVLSNTAEARPGDPGDVPARLILSRLTEDQPVILSEEHIVLPPGKKVFTSRQQIDAPNFYTYEARIIPDRPEDDVMPQNNRATAFTQVQGKGQVLLIEDCEHRGEHDVLVDRLRQQGLEVSVRRNDQLFSSLAELQPYDTVILANVPRATNQDVGFSDEQIAMLVRNTQQLGAGLVMLGGPNSFGAGGWAGTELENAMPVDFQIRNAKVIPRGALVMLMHASEIATGNTAQKVIAKEALKSLMPQDYCGLIHYGMGPQWLWGNGLWAVGRNRDQMLSRIDRMTPGDMPDFEPLMVQAYNAFTQVPDAAVKHMIIISDGDPSAPTGATVTRFQKLGVTISTVAVGAHGAAGSSMMAGMAQQTGGKYYAVNNPKALPRIYQREARRVARPVIFEDEKGMRLQAKSLSEMLSGVEALPPITGYVLTTKKENPLVEVALVAPKPAGEDNRTVLAGWPFGAGKAVAFTSDDGARWTKQWPSQAAYDKVFGQLVRWSMRPAGNTGKFSMSSEIVDNQVRLVVTALDKNDEFLNFLGMSGMAVGPNLKAVPLKMEQTAPGRYVGTFPAGDAGSYFLSVSPGSGMAPIRGGVTVPYSDEFRERACNDALLGQLAALVPKGGQAGRVIEAAADHDWVAGLLAVDTFRHDLPKATRSQDVWHLLLLAASFLFFLDVFLRRVHVSFAWAVPLAARVRDWVLRREAPAAQPQYLARLQSRKAEVGSRLEQLRANTRFEPPPQAAAAPSEILEGPPAATKPAAPPTPELGPQPKSEEESYTERLLKAKKKVWEDKQK